MSASMGDSAWFALFSSLRSNKCLDHLKLGPRLLTHLAFLLSLYKKEQSFIAVQNVQFVVVRQGRVVLIGEHT